LVHKFQFRLNVYQLIKYGIVIGVLVLGWFGGWWDELAKQAVQPRQVPAQPAVPSENLYQTKLVGWDDQKKVWEIEADHIWQSNDQNITYFEKVHSGIIFSVKGKRAIFHAGWARWEKPWANLYIGGNLVVYVEQYKLVTKEVVMRYSSQELTCASPIKLTGPHTLVQAQKMNLKLDQEEVKLEGDVRLAQDEDLVTTKALTFNLKEESYQLIEPGGIILNL
jgi:LPS export ABC transporter protein LptC